MIRWDADHPLLVSATPGMVCVRDGSPFIALKEIENAWVTGQLRSDECWAGALSYDLGRWFEQLPTTAKDDLQLSLLTMAPHRNDRPASWANRPWIQTSRTPLFSTFSQHAYLAAVARCIDYIRAGDIFQVNLSQRFTAPLARSPQDIFHHLQRDFPCRYPAYLDLGDHQIISNSPELFLKVDRLPDGRRRILNRPIKGTRPRALGQDEELERSEKDKAELAMIVDLQRNDLGRVCEIGSVRVIEPRIIEAHPTVYHGVATIEGILREDVGFTDILRATFPCGSITGCPKIRAMEILDGLEPVRRGPYCGAIGWLGSDGSMEWSVAIRTMIVKDGQVHIPVGGGIVADSVPEQEYEETLVKARAMFAAAGVELPMAKES